MPTPYVLKLAAAAEAEYDKYHGLHETAPKLAQRISFYWSSIGLGFPGVSTPWSAVFVSAIVKLAGADASQFLFSSQHSQFVHRAIANATSGIGVFRGFSPADYAPKLGDIIQNNRNGNQFDFAFAKANKDYSSHSAIVVEEGTDGNGRYVRTVGGNEGDSVGDRVVRLRANGLIKPPSSEPTYYISVIQNLR
ncbi:MAG: DUF2272 domain-containing protein [Geminicoccaceae bacterium]